MRRALRVQVGAALVAVVLGGAACSGSTSPAQSASPGAATPAPTDAATSAATPAASASPSLATLPVAQCLTGGWTLVRFVAASNQTYGTGQGGDVTVDFGKDTYTLTGAGKKPMTLTLAGTTAELVVDGESRGTFATKDAGATFTPSETSGSATLRSGNESKQLTMAQIAKVIGLQGDGQVACTADAMTITLSTVRLELGRT